MKKTLAMLLCLLLLCPALPVFAEGAAMVTIEKTQYDASLERLELTRNEYRILHCLMENRGRTVSRETLMERLWETDCFVDDNTLSVNVNRLRKKLEGIGLRDFITTRVGMGYMLN